MQKPRFSHLNRIRIQSLTPAHIPPTQHFDTHTRTHYTQTSTWCHMTFGLCWRKSITFAFLWFISQVLFDLWLFSRLFVTPLSMEMNNTCFLSALIIHRQISAICIKVVLYRKFCSCLLAGFSFPRYTSWRRQSSSLIVFSYSRLFLLLRLLRSWCGRKYFQTICLTSWSILNLKERRDYRENSMKSFYIIHNHTLKETTDRRVYLFDCEKEKKTSMTCFRQNKISQHPSVPRVVCQKVLTMFYSSPSSSLLPSSLSFPCAD